MKGDAADFQQRLYSLLPANWFPDLAEAPILGSVLSGFSGSWAWAYDRVKYTQSQTRIGTATEEWLDLISDDYLGTTLPRRSGETDDSYRFRIKAAILQPRVTRAALSDALGDLTGFRPVLFEPWRGNDTGYYNTPSTLAYNVNGVGGYGNLFLPFQIFITAFLPLSSPVQLANLGGWATLTVKQPTGYGIGSIEYITSNQIASQISTADILNTIVATLPAGTVGWTTVTDPAVGPAQPVDHPLLATNFSISGGENSTLVITATEILVHVQ